MSPGPTEMGVNYRYFKYMHHSAGQKSLEGQHRRWKHHFEEVPLIFIGLNLSNVFWEGNPVRCKESRRVLFIYLFIFIYLLLFSLAFKSGVVFHDC